MTVVNKLNQTLEMLKMVEANCNTFSMDTDDPNAKSMFKQIAQNVKTSSEMLQSRVNFIMSEEPQYRPNNQAQQMQNMQQQQQNQQNQQ
ncbi:DUF1657 domain-containing protein [Maledivibacter halophilus]|uniref:Uncharacterized protein n=1 Tax=Maledivibacter halophilus TaxID=36842 RepID=A0A1T5JEX8_9FIRM|nr:DUF1657 domain-containing protein [Maledivibacter halophilus]SKC50010.1 protein of unknown function [Maledivibacter halophilus]